MQNDTEDALQRAILANKEGLGLRNAAKLWGIPLTTLYRRVNGSKPRKVVAEARQRLSRKQETELAGWVRIQDALGNAPSHSQVIAIASTLLPPSDPPMRLGKHWIEGFLKRNPEIKTLRGKRIDLLRVNGATADRVKDFFAIMNHPAIKHISPRDR
jgi:hypothetical protein